VTSHDAPRGTRSRLIALTREVSPAIAGCELTYRRREPIDIGAAAAQHAAYERALEGLGCAVHRLGAGPDMPDAVFIEDTAVVLDEIAVIARPGAPSRRTETAAVADRLREWRTLCRIEPPGTLDGGDVLVAGRTIFTGSSRRTNAEGIRQLRRLVEPFGYSLRPVDVHGCLHLKSAVTAASARALIVNRRLVPEGAFDGLDLIDVDAGEPGAANVLRVGESLLCAAAYPRTMKRLEEAGIRIVAVDVSELEKAEGAVTCCSLIFAV
jgi:dimethylargininase